MLKWGGVAASGHRRQPQPSRFPSGSHGLFFLFPPSLTTARCIPELSVPAMGSDFSEFWWKTGWTRREVEAWMAVQLICTRDLGLVW